MLTLPSADIVEYISLFCFCFCFFLQSHGVKFVFTLCGGHISPILVSCQNLGIKVVDTRHEVMLPNGNIFFRNFFLSD